MRIMLISDRRLRPLEEIWPFLQGAAQAGLTDLMIREKDLPGGPLFAMVSEAVHRCTPIGIQVVVNDRVDVALAAGAGAVHLGVSAVPVRAAKRIAGSRLRIGVSTHSIEEHRAAESAGADYTTFGPVFSTPSKAAYGPPVGLDALRAACASGDIPLLALGGITHERASFLRGTGIAGVAAISAILCAVDPARAVSELAAALGEGGSV